MEELGGGSEKVETVVTVCGGLGDKGVEGGELIETEGSTWGEVIGANTGRVLGYRGVLG